VGAVTAVQASRVGGAASSPPVTSGGAVAASSRRCIDVSNSIIVVKLASAACLAECDRAISRNTV
jgi:hypothetical protein